MRIRNDVVVSKKKPWTVRWWGKYDIEKEKQPRHSKSFETRKKAEKFAKQIKEPEERAYLEMGKLTLEQLCDKYTTAYKPELEYSSYISYASSIDRLKSYFSPYCHISSIRKEDAIIFVNNLSLIVTGGKVADLTRSRHLRQCRRIFNIAKEWGYIKQNPFNGIKLGKPRKKDWYPLKMEEFGEILKTVDTYAKVTRKNKIADETRILRLKTFYSVMYYCGLRFGEAANLLWDNDNIDFDQNQINIANRFPQKDIPIFNVKDYEARSIPVPQKVMKILKELKGESEQGSSFVFLSPDAYDDLVDRWNKYRDEGKEDWDSKHVISNARRDFKWFCEKAGIITTKVLTLHSLRKGYGTNMANLGIPANTLKDLMGHSSIVTTMEYYVKTLDENKISAAEKLNAVAVV